MRSVRKSFMRSPVQISPNKVVNGTPTTLRSVGAHYHERYGRRHEFKD
jgi:hypothetical protein